jgi:hypothetical protein
MAKHKGGSVSKQTESKERSTGRDYPDDRFTGGGPWNQGIDHYFGNEEHKTLHSPTDTAGGMGIGPLRNDYDDLWEKGK